MFPKIFSKSLLWQIDIPYIHSSGSVHLDLGCGNNPRNPLMAEKVVGLDLQISTIVDELTLQTDSIEFIQYDSTKGLPFESLSIDSISAFDFLEHIPRWERNGQTIEFPFVRLMSEIFRVLKPGGFFLALTPGFPNRAAFSDPTHVNYLSIDSVSYFCSSSQNDAPAKMYGFEGNFKIIHNDWLKGGGPNLQTSLSQRFLAENATLSEKFVIALKLTKRIIGMKFCQSPTHIYWVLQKTLK